MIALSFEGGNNLKIVLATHGFMAKGMKNSVELLLGKRDNICVINAYTDDSDLEEQFNEHFHDIGKEEQVLVFTDLYGGSVNQFVQSKLNDYRIELLASVNMSLVLEFAARDQESYDEDEIEAILNGAREQMCYVNQEMKKLEGTEECDFFEEV